MIIMVTMLKAKYKTEKKHKTQYKKYTETQNTLESNTTEIFNDCIQCIVTGFPLHMERDGIKD